MLMNTEEVQTAETEVLYTVRIELLSNRVVHYLIAPKVRDWLERWITAGPFDHVPASDSFLCFPASPCRVVFARVQDIVELEISPIPIDISTCHQGHRLGSGVPGSWQQTIFDESGQLPSAIIRLRNKKESRIYHNLDPEARAIELNEVNLWQPFFVHSGFIMLQQKNGLIRYITVTNISFMELDKTLIYPEDPWSEMDEEEV